MKKKLFTLVVSAVALLTVQFGTISIASAAADTDLSLASNRNFANQATEFLICNEGPTSIKEVVLELSATNFVFDYGHVNLLAINGGMSNPPTDPGSFDFGSMTWTGLLDATQCVPILMSGSETGTVGQEVTTQGTIVSSVQEDDTVNTDTNNANDTSVTTPYTIELLANITVESLLITTGEITPSTDATYQLNIKNEGPGVFQSSPDFFLAAFVLPEGATFVNAEDANPTDLLTLPANDCPMAGLVGDFVPWMGAEYVSRTVVICPLAVTGNQMPVGETNYPIYINITAGAGLAAGTADVRGILEGNDLETLRLFKDLLAGTNPFDAMTSDNIFALQYDPSALQATVNRCAGQGETTTNGTGCFTITFNKLIYAPSFGTDDINLGGNGTIDSLTQIDDFTWELRVSNITPNTTLTLLLNLNQIQDYSAQQNSTQVLGINTIRYDVSGATTGTANGSLPATGANASISIVALMLIAMGFGLARSFRKKLTS